MKIGMKKCLAGLSGKVDDMVYYYHPGLQQTLARQYTEPARNPSAERLRSVMTNLGLINPAQGYRQNLQDYAIFYNNLPFSRKGAVLTWCNLYLKMLYAMAKTLPGVDLATLTREQIYDQSLPCLTVRTAIDAGLLPAVRGYQELNKMI